MAGNKIVRRTCYLFLIKQYFTGIEIFQAIDTFEKCGFSTAAFANDGENFTGGKRE
jgi:hypothetical protein